MVVCPGCTHDVRAPHKAHYSVGPEHCGPHGNGYIVKEDNAISEFIYQGQTECLVIGGAQTSCMQLRLTVTQFSHLWTVKGSTQRLNIHIKQSRAGGCGIAVAPV